MNWDEWNREYPAREVNSLPENMDPNDGPFSDRCDAEGRKGNLEIRNERGGFEVVIFQNQFYIIG